MKLGEVLRFRFELITGPMSCGKTEELLRRLTRARIANRKVKIFSPAIDTRAPESCIESRNGSYESAIKINSALEILNYVEEDDEVVAIDELQFFERDIVDVVLKLIKNNKKVIGTGLDLDFKEEPFGPIGELFCYADKVDKLTAICMKCGSEFGNRTQRLINGKPADRTSPLIMVGGDEKYEARCFECYEINDREFSGENILVSNK
ncbi:MAG: thymidine kinase [Candidatus Melainabacteria bacterium GWF2_32_7]|nr:MAG: thymidine kinase [Candidatus Melainabacteria bacterium GWF2_32_7]OGI23285.1 MAG: thymidine kinase [Candidatus Melainabacteria bacterium RIFOXYA2_FULL_32_9]